MVAMIICILVACINIPGMIESTWGSYMSFGFCIGLAAAALIDWIASKIL